MSLAKRPSLSLLCTCLAAAGLLVACGGDHDPVQTTVGGSVVKGPVTGANVCAYKAVATGKGDQLKCVTSGAAGVYSLQVDYVGDIVVEASGGTYTDEATNTQKTLSDPMQVVVAANGGTTTGIVTPLTTVAYNLSKSGTGGVTSAGFSSSVGTLNTMFGLGGVSWTTTLPVVTPGTTQRYGQVLRAISQFNANGGTLASFFAFNNPSSLQALFNAAFAQANAGAAGNFNLTVPAPAPTPAAPAPAPTPAPPAPAPTPAPPAPAPTPAPPAPAPAPAPSGNKTLVVQVTVMGTSTTTTLNNIPQPTTQAEFCDGLSSDTTFKSLAAQGGSMTINSCSYSGNVGNISATITMTTPIAMTVPYTILYTYQ